MVNISIDCSKCPTRGSCCYSFDMKREIVLKNLDKIQVTPLNTIEGKDIIKFITEDNRCIFLHRKTNCCTIYNDRPQVCMNYGSKGLPCPYFKQNGIKRSEASKKQLMRKIINNIKRHEDLN